MVSISWRLCSTCYA